MRDAEDVSWKWLAVTATGAIGLLVVLFGGWAATELRELRTDITSLKIEVAQMRAQLRTHDPRSLSDSLTRAEPGV
jgi:hypothetical protein